MGSGASTASASQSDAKYVAENQMNRKEGNKRDSKRNSNESEAIPKHSKKLLKSALGGNEKDYDEVLSNLDFNKTKQEKWDPEAKVAQLKSSIDAKMLPAGALPPRGVVLPQVTTSTSSFDPLRAPTAGRPSLVGGRAGRGPRPPSTRPPPPKYGPGPPPGAAGAVGMPVMAPSSAPAMTGPLLSAPPGYGYHQPSGFAISSHAYIVLTLITYAPQVG